MRSVLIFSLAVLGLTQNALAADYPEDAPYLRGSEVYAPPAPKAYTRWSGFYAGGNLEYGSASMDFTKATDSLAAYSLRYLSLETETNVSGMQLLDSKHTGGAGFGFFAGYNTQWEDVVLGLEASYSKNSFTATATSNPLNQNVTAGGIPYNIQLDGAASMHIIDYGELRGRVGYAIGCFLPYFTGGFALGRVDFTRSWILNGIANPGTASAFPFVYSNNEAKSNVFVGGWSIGGGIDVQLWQRAFLRGEVDYVTFAPISGIRANIVAGRVGAGVRF